MNAIKVFRYQGCWYTACATHGTEARYSAWRGALEAAYGHAAHWHPQICTHEIGWHPVDRPDQHRCLDCGTPIAVGAR